LRSVQETLRFFSLDWGSSRATTRGRFFRRPGQGVWLFKGRKASTGRCDRQGQTAPASAPTKNVAVKVGGGAYQYGWVDMPSMIRFNSRPKPVDGAGPPSNVTLRPGTPAGLHSPEGPPGISHARPIIEERKKNWIAGGPGIRGGMDPTAFDSCQARRMAGKTRSRSTGLRRAAATVRGRCSSAATSTGKGGEFQPNRNIPARSWEWRSTIGGWILFFVLKYSRLREPPKLYGTPSSCDRKKRNRR